MRTVRVLLLLEAISLLVAALFHTGSLTDGSFDDAAIYESTIALVLLGGLGLGVIWPSRARASALAAQAVGLAGASIGLFVAIRGVGPNSIPDMVYHVALIATLLWGMAAAWRWRPTGSLVPDGTAL